MDLLDLIVIVVAVIAAAGRLPAWASSAGWRRGWGWRLGFYVAVRLLPSVIVRPASSSPGVQLTVAILLLVGGAMIGQAIGLLIGARLHRALPLGPVRQADRVLGAGLGIVVVDRGARGCCCRRWRRSPGGRPGRRPDSAISRWVSRDLPTPAAGPAGAAPPDRPGRPAGVRRPQPRAPRPGRPRRPARSARPSPPRSSASTVKVEGQACNLHLRGQRLRGRRRTWW